jgi:hypothetical protein
VAVEQLHHDEVLAGVFADIVDGADMRVVERRGQARLASETFEGFGMRGELGRQKLSATAGPRRVSSAR